MNSKISVPCATLLFACLVSGAALADATSPSRTVTFADLNLNSSGGVNTLYRRIELAAAKVCVVPRDTLQVKAEPFLKTCKANAVAGAVDKIGLPELSSLHRAKSGRADDTMRLADGK